MLTVYVTIVNAAPILPSPAPMTASYTMSDPLAFSTSGSAGPSAYPTPVPTYTPTSDQVPVLFEPNAESDTPEIPSKTSWALPPTFSNMDPFTVTAYAAGTTNLAILSGSPAKVTNATGPWNITSETQEHWDYTSNSLQVFYPSGSINPGNKPQGGAEFYAKPIDLTLAQNASLEYSVYFPFDFDFVKGGKLPGLYGGHKGCSGGNAAAE